MGRVLVVDDEPGIRDALEFLIASKSHAVVTAASVSEARARLEEGPLDLVITDLRLEPGGDGIDVIRAARKRSNPPEVIVMTAFGTRDRARLAVQEGAAFYLEKGPHLATDIEVLVSQAINSRQIREENEHLRQALSGAFSIGGLVGKSQAMREVVQLIERMAPSLATVLITGESGTGKERVARALHHGSPRCDGPFVPQNCGAIPENLIEAEFFGYEKGAFTGADASKAGLFMAANGGTIFLDEVAELPFSLQSKLLRVLQERRVKPVGAVAELEIDVRIIAATNADLESEVKRGRFREDLFFRLKVLEIDLPPLRHRREDIPLLASTFVERFAREYGRPVRGLSAPAMKALLTYDFPGNIRQLEHAIERGVALSDGGELQLEALPKEVRFQDARPDRLYAVEGAPAFPDEGVDLERLVDHFEHGLITRALEKAGGVKTRAAELLGLSFRQFRYKLAKHEKQKENDRSTSEASASATEAGGGTE
ncbi:MAG: sigma-54-dependent Fis family transcriptional regulator [Deltaproteobacteria bacterium]|nr:sigma-54-dependent Fis family transcriptional regulator [Deltaproteobacteria bacterium]